MRPDRYDDYDRDVLFLGLTAYAEASSEGQDGIRAQIHSVLNRWQEKDWDAGETVASTCMRAYAYSAWNTTDPNRVRALSVPMGDKIIQMCISEAEGAISGTTQDPTDGATHYYREGTPEPDWVSGIRKFDGKRVAPPATFTIQIGHHLFYKNVA